MVTTAIRTQAVLDSFSLTGSRACEVAITTASASWLLQAVVFGVVKTKAAVALNYTTAGIFLLHLDSLSANPS